MLRPAILHAAMELFAQKGFEQPTMDELATAARVSKATLYSYFDGKSVLIDAVIDALLQALPTLRATDDGLPLREQFLDIGLQARTLAAHPAAVALTRRLAERRLSGRQLAAWRKRHEAYEAFLAGLLERHCDCEHPGQVASLFLLLAVGGLRPEPAVPHVFGPPGIESAVDLILRAYPERRGSRR